MAVSDFAQVQQKLTTCHFDFLKKKKINTKCDWLITPRQKLIIYDCKCHVRQYEMWVEKGQ